MSFLQNLFSNDKMKDMAFGLLKKQMVENNIKYFVVELLPDGSIDTKMYLATAAPEIYSKEQTDKMQEILLELEKNLTGFEEVIHSLTEQIGKLTQENEALYAALNDEPEPDDPTPGVFEVIETKVDNSLIFDNGSNSAEAPE